MTQYLNRAAVSSWVDASASVQARLEKIFQDSGLDDGTVDAWTNDIIRNTFETVPEPHSGHEVKHEIR
ncbi:hypothetical protein ASG19_07205 [Rhizobium sp. Leaf306]|nr:hypothetical protein ASG19_07205 [Rhizobium sp. Leaf306]